MKLNTNPLYPITGRPDYTTSPPGEVTRYFLSPEEHEHYKQIPTPQKSQNLDTTAPQRRRYNPGVTKTHSWEKRGGEGR
jgi:hypothetical protein